MISIMLVRVVQHAPNHLLQSMTEQEQRECLYVDVFLTEHASFFYSRTRTSLSQQVFIRKGVGMQVHLYARGSNKIIVI